MFWITLYSCMINFFFARRLLTCYIPCCFQAAADRVTPFKADRKQRTDRELTRWLACRQRPFSLPETDIEFREFIRHLTNGAYTPPSSKTVKKVS